jgi:hypothetical protein
MIAVSLTPSRRHREVADFTLALVLWSSFGAMACKRAETTVPEGDLVEDGFPSAADGRGEVQGREVVDNWRAKPGDVTTCPISGKKFEVEANSPRFSYQGYNFVFCCCLEQVEANPAKLLDRLVEEAGGPASDPDRSEGDAIDDS